MNCTAKTINAGSGGRKMTDTDMLYMAALVKENDRWDIGISLQDEELSLPDWDMRISFEGYTTVLEIDVPDDVELTWYNNGERTV